MEHRECFNRATLKLDGAKSLISALAILVGDDMNNNQISITGTLLNSAMAGIGSLIDSAIDDLLHEDES